jgi:Cys-rich four helix bundle protein (predicted Tat secretion target)
MNVTRRTVLLAGASAVVAQAASRALAAGEASASAPAGALADAAGKCVVVGDACLQHCLDLLAKGDTTLAECAQSVRQMLAICAAVGPIAAAGGKYLKSTARVCLDVCTDCEQVCRKHEAHHAVCKDCADTCARVVAECKKVLA